MSKSNLPENFVDDPELLLRQAKKSLRKKTSPPLLEDSTTVSIRRSLTPDFEVMANKTLREFSAPTTDNIRTGPAVDTGDKAFELKPALINMVQASQFCGKAHEDASAHLQHFLEICSTFTIKDISRDAILLRLFPFSLLGKAKQWFYANKDKLTTWALCSTAFLSKFFPIGKTNALRGKISSFQQQQEESVPEAWERFQDYILECPHHGMENWLLMQTFYHGLTNSTRETMDAAAGGAFLSLTLNQATNLVEKMASNQVWNEERQPRRKERGMHQLKEVDMLSAKMDLIMKRLDERAPEKKEVMHIYDSRMTCEECGNTGHTGVHCPELEEEVSYVNNNQYRPQQNPQWTQQRPSYPGNYSGNYQGNYQGNNFSNQPPLRELVLNQGKIMENLSKKIASNDKSLETISNRMDSISSAIKSQNSFNKMIESQISQLAISTAMPSKIPGQPEELESANLVDLYDPGYYIGEQSQGWMDDSMPEKKEDPGRPVVPITIGAHFFKEALCDFGASINIMPKVIYEKIQGARLLYTTMCIQLADQSLCYPKGVLQDVCVKIGNSYVPADFVVIETGGDDRAPIILGRPFLCTAKATIHADTAKISFNIKGRTERFNFKKKMLTSPAQPQMPYAYQRQLPFEQKKKNGRRTNNQYRRDEPLIPESWMSEREKKLWKRDSWMVNTVDAEWDFYAESPLLPKLEDPGVPTILSSINQWNFPKTLCDTGSGVNLMAKSVYRQIYGDLPLFPTYMRIQMADQSLKVPEGIAKDVPVKIQDHYVLTDFLVIDMGEEEYDPPLVLGRPFLNTTRAIIYIRKGEIHFQFPKEKVRCYFNTYTYDPPKKHRSKRRGARGRKYPKTQREIEEEWGKEEVHTSMTKEEWDEYVEEKKETKKEETITPEGSSHSSEGKGILPTPSPEGRSPDTSSSYEVISDIPQEE